MKIIITLLLSLFTLNVFAKTQGYFPITGQQAMINMKTKAFMEEDDLSPKKLFDSMNVPPKNSIGGNGKKIESSDKNLSIVCADQGNEQYFCNITIKKSSECQINPRDKSVKCFIQGVAAFELFNLFFYQGDEYFYQNETGELSIQAHHNQFILKFTDWD